MSSNMDYLHSLPVTWELEYAGDLLFAPGAGTVGVMHWSPWIKVSDSICIPQFDSEADNPSNLWLCEKPSDYEWNWRDDSSKYGGIFPPTHASYAVAGLSGRFREGQTHHVRHVGHVYDVQDDLSNLVVTPLRPNYVPGLGYVDAYRHPDLIAWSHPDGYRPIFRKTSLTAGNHMVFEESRTNWNGYPTISFKFRDFFRGNMEAVKDVGWSYSRGAFVFTYSNFEDHSDYDLDIYNAWYDFHVHCNTGYMGYTYYGTYRVHLDFSFVWNHLYGDNSASEWNGVGQGILGVINNSTVEVKEPITFSWAPGAPGNTNLGSPFAIYAHDYDNVVGSVACSISTISQNVDARSNFELFSKAGANYTSYRWKTVEGKFNQALPHLRPAGFLATSEGLNSHLEVLKANHLENLSQIGGILELIPDLKGLLRLAAKASRGDPSALKDLVDYITDAILRFRFSQKPTSDDIDEITSTDVLAELETLTRGSSEKTLYGKFDYSFSDSENYMKDGRLVLSVRSKSRVGIDMSTLLVAYIISNGLGLAPTLERLWNTMPFSFVVDWFISMDKRLGAVDSQRLWLSVRSLWNLYSYKVIWFPSSELLLSYDLASSEDDPFGISVYEREITYHPPRLSESKYDFLRPARGPDILTAGSLLWQILS